MTSRNELHHVIRMTKALHVLAGGPEYVAAPRRARLAYTAQDAMEDALLEASRMQRAAVVAFDGRR